MSKVKFLLDEPKANGEKRQVLIVTDGVFSMDGDLALLPEIIKVAKKYKALTMVDDAHGEGVLGEHGRGIVDYYHLHGQVDIEVGTLSKAFGVMGGFITGKKELIDYYHQKARQFLFTNALSPADAAALIEAVKILEESDELIKKLWSNTKRLKALLSEAGFDLGQSVTPITPVMVGDENKTKEFAAKLYDEGVLVSAIKYPMVPLGKARLRLMPSAAHQIADIEKGAAKIIKIGRKLGIL